MSCQPDDADGNEEEGRLLEALELQVAEVEMLSSMYPSNREFMLDDPVTLELIKAVIGGEIDAASLETGLGFKLQLSCRDKGKVLHVDLVCQLPHQYPFTKPQIYLQTSDSLSRERLKILRDDLSKEIESQSKGDIIIGVVAEWLKERLYQEVPHIGVAATTERKTEQKKTPAIGNGKVTRLWIYSHHIYSKIKRKDIKDWGAELNLRGFCMPGKPGVICAEGPTAEVDDFWYRIRRMNWKKICIKEQEVAAVPKGQEVTSLYKFDPFRELVFDVRGGKGREYHMDLGQFKTFLQEHDSGHIFSLYFGLDGRLPTGDDDNDDDDDD